MRHLRFYPLVIVWLILLAVPALGQDESAAPDDVIDVFEVSGLIDPVNADAIVHRIETAEADGALALVLQVNSPGDVIGPDGVAELRRRIASAAMPIGVWVGPAGSKATGGAGAIALDADLIGISVGSSLGDVGDEVEIPPELEPMRDETVSVDEARELGLPVTDANVLGEFILALEDAELVPQISEVVTADDGTPRRQVFIQIRFNQLPLFQQLLHTVASPPVAYLLLLTGMGLILLEFFTGGIGIAAGTGAFAVLLSGYGLGVLETNPAGVGLLVAAFVAFGVDVQTGVPRFWSGVGAVLLTMGTFFLYDGHSLSWLSWLVGVGLTLVLVLSGLPSLVRTRYSTPTLGREWMMGEMGTAVAAVSPDGVVEVNGAKWKARTNRATPIEAGAPARVVGISGVVLEVEPESGGAVDYRERRRKKRSEVEQDTISESGAAGPEPT